MAMRKHTQTKTLEGAVERVTFHNEETGFAVLKVKARGMKDLCTVVGQLPMVTAGEWIKGTGSWIVDREHGRQFKANHLQTMPPDSIEGITKFLGSGIIKGIGPVYAEKMVAKFGKNVFTIMDTESARLEKIEGIGKKRRLLIKEGWKEAREIREIMTFLFSHGVSSSRAFRIYKTYGEKAIELVREDPYRLARDIHGIGFKTADKIAANLGIEKNSDLRARAGVEYVLHELTQAGHCAYPRLELVEKTTEILDIDSDIIQTAIEYGISTERLIQDDITGDSLIYLTSLYYAETHLATCIHHLNNGQHPCPPFDAEKAIEWVQSKINLTLSAEQQDAIRTAVHSKFMIITGGPGVGKTTLVNAIIRIFKAKNLKIIQAAPTGRAAKRMTETTGHTSKTIHRLLDFDPRRNRFKHDTAHPLHGDIFIIDESSMMDLPLAHSLLQAIPSHAAVILVGDVDQLPSVGPGNILRDIIDSDYVPVCRLKEIFRQSSKSHIVVNAHMVNAGQVPETTDSKTDSDFYFIECEEPEKVAETIAKLVKTSIPKRFRLNPVNDVQILTPMRRGILGAQNLNTVLQKHLNPSAECIERYGYIYRNGDKVMQQENDYDKEVFNGDIGRITAIRHFEREVDVKFEGRIVTYDMQELDELIPSYAITIHKSQGSEYPCVIIPVHTQHFIMLQRNLIYTAITRGKKLVILIGTQKAMGIAVQRLDIHERVTALRERIVSVISKQ